MSVPYQPRKYSHFDGASGRTLSRLLRYRARQSFAHEPDVLAQDVELVGERERHFHFVDGDLHVVEALEQLLARVAAIVERAAFERDQLAIPAIETRPHAPTVDP